MVRTSPAEVKHLLVIRWERVEGFSVLLLPAAAALTLPAASFAGDLAALAAGFAQSDGDCLLAAGDLLARPPGFQRAALAFVHRAFDLALRFLAVLRHETH